MKNILLTLFQIISAIFILPFVAVVLFFIVWYTSIIFPVMLIAEILSEFSKKVREPFTLARIYNIWSNGVRIMRT